jgi:hypothetical protein
LLAADAPQRRNEEAEEEIQRDAEEKNEAEKNDDVEEESKVVEETKFEWEMLRGRY